MINCIAVTGITGHTGGYFLEELVKNNFAGTVRCLVRKSSNMTALYKSGLRIESLRMTKTVATIMSLRVMNLAINWNRLNRE